MPIFFLRVFGTIDCDDILFAEFVRGQFNELKTLIVIERWMAFEQFLEHDKLRVALLFFQFQTTFFMQMVEIQPNSGFVVCYEFYSEFVKMLKNTSKFT